MKLFRTYLGISFLLTLFFIASCSGGSGNNGSAGSNNAVNTANEKILTPDGNSSLKENSDDTDARLENYATQINAPKDVVFGVWKDYSASRNFKSLNDIDITSVEMLRDFIFKFIGRTDLAWKFVAMKIFGKEEMAFRIQKNYKDLVTATFANQDEFNNKFGKEFYRELRDFQLATAIFARLLQNDLQTLFPGRFSVNFNLLQCNNSPCNEFVQKSLKLVDDSANATYFNNQHVEEGKTARAYLGEFFAAIFNNVTFAVGDKYYSFYNFKTGEATIEAITAEYFFQPSQMTAPLERSASKIEYQEGQYQQQYLQEYTKTNKAEYSGSDQTTQNALLQALPAGDTATTNTANQNLLLNVDGKNNTYNKQNQANQNLEATDTYQPTNNYLIKNNVEATYTYQPSNIQYQADKSVDANSTYQTSNGNFLIRKDYNTEANLNQKVANPVNTYNLRQSTTGFIDTNNVIRPTNTDSSNSDGDGDKD